MGTSSTSRATDLPSLARPSLRPARRRAIAAWITTGLFAALMATSGVLYLLRPPALVAGIAALGYPAYFLGLLGVAKLLGVAGLLVPRRPTLREWAYAGFTFDLIAAVVSHVATGTASHAAQPLLVLALLAASYVLRRQSPHPEEVSP